MTMAAPVSPSESPVETPFAAFRADITPHEGLRAAIDAAYRRPEHECLPALIESASLAPPMRLAAQVLWARDPYYYEAEGAANPRPSPGLDA